MTQRMNGDEERAILERRAHKSNRKSRDMTRGSANELTSWWAMSWAGVLGEGGRRRDFRNDAAETRIGENDERIINVNIWLEGRRVNVIALGLQGLVSTGGSYKGSGKVVRISSERRVPSNEPKKTNRFKFLCRNNVSGETDRHVQVRWTHFKTCNHDAMILHFWDHSARKICSTILINAHLCKKEGERKVDGVRGMGDEPARPVR